MEILLEPTSNKLLVGTLSMLQHSSQRSQIHKIKLSMSNHCLGRFLYNQDYPPQEVVNQSRISRYNPSKDRDLNIGGDQRLEIGFSENEVWEAIRGCGREKSPKPNGFNSKFIRKTCEIIKLDLLGEVQNEFIKGRYILDEVIIANETMDFFVEKERKGLNLLVDFEKAYDSINWRFLLGIMRRIDKGIYYLLFFILAAKGLNAIVFEAVEKGIFKGVVVGDNNVMISHLQYADDTILFKEWNKENAKSLMCILKCFKEVSMLKVNYNKSKIYGIRVNEEELEEMVRYMRCGFGEFLFTYLGLPIGEKMRRIKHWGLVVEKIKKRLADWKDKTMSFRGYLTLVKSILGSLPLYYCRRKDPTSHSRYKKLLQQIGAICRTSNLIYHSNKMAGPTEWQARPKRRPEGQDAREETLPPLMKEEIDGHLSALKSIIKDQNRRNRTDPIWLYFEEGDTEARDNRIVKGKEVVDDDLKKPFKEALKMPLTHRIIELASTEYKMPNNIKLYTMGPSIWRTI
nr:putative ribonuclease H protein At1g65750 family [Tanacetum cinerariifolium]